MRNKLVIACGLSVLASTLPPLHGQEGPKQSFEVSSKERLNFPPGGTIFVDNSYGYLTVEGWDEPEVEVTIIKSTNSFYHPNQKEQAEQRFNKVRVATERRSAKALAISTILPSRHSKAGVTLEYRILVPRNSSLVVRHDNGYVWVSDITGDLEVKSHTGDMIVMLPDPGPYAIDARSRMGSVSSDFVGKFAYRFVLGTHFARPGEAPSRRIYLRMGHGCITIKQGPRPLPFTND